MMLHSNFMISVQSNLFRFIEKQFRSTLKASHSFVPIWIIGAPRTGTTLIYQALCSAFDCTYITNRIAERYRIAVIARVFKRNFINKSLNPSNYSSKYGRTQQPGDPHEAGAFFYQYFPKEKPYTTVSAFDASDKIELANVISEIAKPSPLFISKNTYHSLRIQVLKEIFPSSIFIWVRRDEASTIKSIYLARSRNKDIRKWWGINPPGWEQKENESPLEQIHWQVHKTNEIIKKDLEQTKAKYFEMNYSEFCEQPLNVIHDFMNSCNLSPSFLRNSTNIPAKFEQSKHKGDELDEMIKNFLDTVHDRA